MVCYNHSSLTILVNDAKYIQFLLISSTSLSPFILQVQTTHKITRLLLILLQKLVILFASNIGILYNLNKYTQDKHNEKLFDVICLHLHIAIALHHLDENEKLLEIFVCPSNSCAFYRPELNL